MTTAARCLLRAVLLSASIPAVICIMVGQGLVAKSQNMSHPCAQCDIDLYESATKDADADPKKPFDPNALPRHLLTLTIGALVVEGCCLLVNVVWAWQEFKNADRLLQRERGTATKESSGDPYEATIFLAFMTTFMSGVYGVAPFGIFLWVACAPSWSCLFAAWYVSIPSLVGWGIVLTVCATGLLMAGAYGAYQVFQYLRKYSPWSTTLCNIITSICMIPYSIYDGILWVVNLVRQVVDSECKRARSIAPTDDASSIALKQLSDCDQVQN